MYFRLQFRLPAKRKPILDLGPRGGLRAAFSRGLEIHRAAKVSGEMFRYTKEFRDAIGSLRIDRFDLSGHNADIRRYATDSFWLNEAAAGTRGRLSGPARPLRGTRRHGSLLNTNPVEAGSMERRRGMVKNDGTADSKERRHNGNGWRGVGRLGRAGKRAAGRREGEVAGCFTRR